jgi:uncharacterized protein YegP (UPF0339 family)
MRSRPASDSSLSFLYGAALRRPTFVSSMNTTYKIYICKARNKEFFWRIVHRNRRQIARSSETYKRRSSCLRGLMRLINKFVFRDYEISE